MHFVSFVASVAYETLVWVSAVFGLFAYVFIWLSFDENYEIVLKGTINPYEVCFLVICAFAMAELFVVFREGEGND